MNGRRYADQLELGRARPYQLDGDVRHTLLAVLSTGAVDMLEHLEAMHRRSDGGRGGGIISHVDTARILRCSSRWAGDVMRELAELGLVEPHWEFRALAPEERSTLMVEAHSTRVRKHQEMVHAYVLTKRAREFFGRRDRRFLRSPEGGTKFHPGGSPASPSGKHEGVRARRPEQIFVSDVLRARQGKKQRVAPARVYVRMPDGRKQWCETLRPGVGRLATARARAPVDDTSIEYFAHLARGAFATIAKQEGGGDA